MADDGFGDFLLALGTKVAVPIAASKYNSEQYQKQAEIDVQKARNAELSKQLQNQVATTQTVQNWYTQNSATIVKITNILLLTVAAGVLSFIVFDVRKRRRG